jgi:LCP family protein required for cell wall assembly
MAKGGPRSIYEHYSSGPARPRRRLPWWVMLLAVAPVTGLVAVGVYVGSLLLATQQAMNEVFVPSVRATYAPAMAAAPTVPAEPAPTAAPGELPPTRAPAGPTAAPVVLPEWQGTDRLNVLLLGVDRRDGEDLPRSDTMILVSIDPVSKRVGMLSIPRDLWVTIPGYGPNKINAAFPLGEQSKLPGGGAGLVMQTVEYNFKLPVHHFATVDFRGFIKIIDAVGGIAVEVPYALKDDEYPADEGPNYTRLYIPAGLQWMDGATALRYARSRHFDTDFGRQRRQQQVLQAIRDQGLKLNLLPRLPELITLLSGSVRTDLDPRQLPALARLGAQIERDQIKSYGITADMTVVHDSPELFYLEPNWPKINAALREMLGGAPAPAQPPAPRTPSVQPPPPRAVATARPTEPAATATPGQRLAATATRAIAPTATPAAGRATATAAATAVAARVRVWVRNSTRVQGLAARTADQLRARGYAIVDVTQDANAGQYPKSIVAVYGVERAEGVALAQAIGLPASAVRAGAPPAPPGTDILVILGEDAAR